MKESVPVGLCSIEQQRGQRRTPAIQAGNPG